MQLQPTDAQAETSTSSHPTRNHLIEIRTELKAYWKQTNTNNQPGRCAGRPTKPETTSACGKPHTTNDDDTSQDAKSAATQRWGGS